jgi:hypothetical protein
VSPYDEEGKLRHELRQLRNRNRELVAESRSSAGNLQVAYWQEAKVLLDHAVQEYYASLVSQHAGDKGAKDATATRGDAAVQGQAWSAAFPWLRSAEELGQQELQQARAWFVGRVDAAEAQLKAALAEL